ncbi:MAG: hypothetical protein A3F77_01310 [Betaproteobacteria bacterium RIFCSPLOWO2_12_FULL_67_28]|nr:MAG: hypothetical protein A3I65_03675 [Betaproteobacteria bacterium RIFCSPLOWO2_02_FULL_68_150]OGA67519.1 MAG: hypothetical protein A3F77_01310 [Betaproteobacteria bacterium RIFCSPLOWO2_12_FULL_67_28]
MRWIGVRSCLAAWFLGGCASAPPPDWQLNARAALAAFEHHYLVGDTRLAEQEFARARAEIARTGRGDLLARAELVRCATRAASLEFDECPGFERLRADAGAEELGYAEYLAGRADRAATEDPLSRLVGAGVQFKSGKIAPAAIGAAVDTASGQGWRRPLLAWLGVQAKRAQDAGDREAATRIQRRIDTVLGTKIDRPRAQ